MPKISAILNWVFPGLRVVEVLHVDNYFNLFVFLYFLLPREKISKWHFYWYDSSRYGY